MPSKIHILADQVINKIAAGEVVERPASVVKELIENSIDAGATGIFIDIVQAGRRLIRVTDNGCGMSKEDAGNAFLRHATSKITDERDLEFIGTMGFRGEALSSVASVSHVRLLTAMKGVSSGTLIEIEGGVVKAVSDAAAPEGTSIEISHLFFNTPARLKFLKSPATEYSHILTAVSRQAMAHPDVRFTLNHNQKTVLDLPSSQNIKERVLQLYGGEIADSVIEFNGGRDNVRVHGLLGRPGASRADKTYQDFFVNRRAVRNPSLAHALYSAYGDMLMRDRHPLAFIFLDIDPALVDVNVHPAKAEVRFRNQSQLHDLVRDAIREGLRIQGDAVNIGSADRVKEAIADFGLRIADLPGTSAFSAGRGGSLHPEARTEEWSGAKLDPQSASLFQSAIRNPQSEILYPLAQIHDSFIIAQSREGMAIVDEHAAHERVLFEKLQDLSRTGAITVQNLLVPDQVELGPAQSALLVDYLQELSAIGFQVEDFGNGTFMIKAIPALLTGTDCKKLLLDILDDVNAHGESAKMEKVRNEILSVMACHPAIKVHRHLEQREMETLLHDLFQCRMPHTCPHGRPTVIRFPVEDIMKMFKRL